MLTSGTRGQDEISGNKDHDRLSYLHFDVLDFEPVVGVSVHNLIMMLPRPRREERRESNVARYPGMGYSSLPYRYTRTSCGG
jgi:hypothetical protein